MIGDHPTTSGSSDRAAEDRPPAQPLSLFTVLQQEFEELHGRAGCPTWARERVSRATTSRSSISAFTA
jgi:hypothetical protein